MDVHPLRVLIKAAMLFVVFNMLYASVDPPISISAYNVLLTGRVRMPFGGEPYSVMVDDLHVMFASHAIARRKDKGEFRVALIGDSSVWSEDIQAEESISEMWNKQKEKCGNDQMIFYNLGYPHPSVIKDLVIMEQAMEYEPDGFVWFITANTIMPRRVNPFITTNREETLHILDSHQLSLTGEDALRASEPAFFDKTIVGRRSLLARWFKLQILGAVWGATRLDMPPSNEPPAPVANDLKDDNEYLQLDPNTEIPALLLFDGIHAAHDLAGQTPILIVNEPIFIASGENSSVRYNDAYPRWAYDQYRDALARESEEAGWNFIDLWDAIPPEYFLTSLHVSGEGERLLVEKINPILEETFCH